MAPGRLPLTRETLFAVDGLIAVITGGGSGIGWLMAKSLAENGAKRVYIIGRREDKLREAADGYDKYAHVIYIIKSGIAKLTRA
jgi:NADP-dependent 3-hydroxy acid dehydrogenase YdfG